MDGAPPPGSSGPDSSEIAIDTASALFDRTLVLNESWTAIRTVSVRHALSLMCKGSARAVQPSTYEVHGFESWAALAVAPHEPCIRTVKLRIRVPEVIVLERYNGLPVQAAVFTRRNLFRRDHNQCQYCGARPGTSELSIDHVIPRARGGLSSWDNCVLACTTCNHSKRDRTPEAAGMKLLRKPAKPKWSPMIEIPIGRVKTSWERFISDAYWNVTLEP